MNFFMTVYGKLSTVSIHSLTLNGNQLFHLNEICQNFHLISIQSMTLSFNEFNTTFCGQVVSEIINSKTDAKPPQ